MRVKLLKFLFIAFLSIGPLSAKDLYQSGFYVYNIEDSFWYTPGDYQDWQETQDESLDHPHHMFQTIYKFSGPKMGRYTCFFGNKTESIKFFLELFNDKVRVNGNTINTLEYIKGSDKNILSFQLLNTRDAMDLGRKITVSIKRCSQNP